MYRALKKTCCILLKHNINLDLQPPKQKISDPDELAAYKLRKRKVSNVAMD